MDSTKINLLLVEDNPGDARLVQEMLKEEAHHIDLTHITKLSDIKQMKGKIYDIVLLDLHLPDSTGLNTVIRTQGILNDTPIIVLTGLDNEELSLSSIQTGAQDYLVKGQIKPKQLIKTIKYAIHRYQTLKKINASNAKQKAFLSTHDIVTGLTNEQLFIEHLELMVSKNSITKNLFALLLIEIHEFNKIINHFGHVDKNLAIFEIAKNLKHSLQELPILARYRENIFAGIHTNLSNQNVVIDCISNIQSALNKKISIADQEYYPSYSIGVAVFPYDGDNSEVIIKNAEIALDKAKHKGIGEYEIFSRELSVITQQNEIPIWHHDIHQALTKQEFYMEYQPQFDITTQRINGMEALLRWQHPKQGLISPSQFIPIAEDSHLILPIGNWILETVCQQYHLWQKKLNNPMKLRVSVNVSVYQLLDSQFVTTVKDIIDRYKIPPNCLELELTESVFIMQPEAVIEKLNSLKQLGVQIAIDDFGRGYSSFSYLSHLPIDYIKLDIDFVQRNYTGTPTFEIVKSIIDLAHHLNFKVIAEGIESEEQFHSLRQQKCDEAQGFYFSKPLSVESFTEFMILNA